VVSLMMAQRCDASIHAIELDEGSFVCTKVNFSKSPWSHRLSVSHGDATKPALLPTGFYDLVVCNPPYFSASMLSNNERKNLSRHQESLTPITLIDAFMDCSTEKGNLFIISTPEYVQEVISQGVLKGLWCKKTIDVYSKPGRAVIRQLLWMSKEKSALESTKFYIRKGDEENGDSNFDQAQTTNYSSAYRLALENYLLKI